MANDFFDTQLNDFQRLYPQAGTTKAGNGLTGPDYAGIGLQLYGATLQDKAADAAEEERKRQERLAMILRGREDRTSAEQFERGAMQTDRAMNMTGSSMLSDMRANALKNRRLFSTRKAFSGAF